MFRVRKSYDSILSSLNIKLALGFTGLSTKILAKIFLSPLDTNALFKRRIYPDFPLPFSPYTKVTCFPICKDSPSFNAFTPLTFEIDSHFPLIKFSFRTLEIKKSRFFDY